MRITDKYIFFWEGELSNFYPCNLSYLSDNTWIKCTTSEQMFMWFKAITFQDYDTAKLILQAETPKEAKKLGRKVKGFDESTWNLVKEKIMRFVLYKKFMYNAKLRDYLLNPEFDGKIFVEASPYDKIWGVGLGQDDPLIDDENNWLGQNLLGKLLTDLREIIKIECNNEKQYWDFKK